MSAQHLYFATDSQLKYINYIDMAITFYYTLVMNEIKPVYHIEFKFFDCVEWKLVTRIITACTHDQLYEIFLEETKAIHVPYSNDSLSVETMQANLWNHITDVYRQKNYPTVEIIL